MRDLQPRGFSQLERKQIIKHIIDRESAIYVRYERLGDLHPRNVIVKRGPNSKDNGIRTFVVLDIGLNILTRHW